MAVIRYLLERLGFVRLERYGLVRTPEGRILSIRPAVLDDGTGGRIVGWREGDPAVAELSAWSASMRATEHRAAAPVVAAPLVAAPAVQVAGPAVTIVPSLGQAPAAASATVMPVSVAPDAVVDEDDWEWTIALARARVAADEAATAASAGPPPSPSPPSPPSPIRTRPMAVVAMKEPTSGAIEREDHAQHTPTPAVAIPHAPAAPRPAMPRAPTPSTVIPVPKLPSVKHSGKAGRFEPVVRTVVASTPPASPASPASPYRIAKGTGSVGSTTPKAAPALSDDTVPDLSIGDRTKPGVALPPAARAVQLPSVKRRMARQRQP